MAHVNHTTNTVTLSRVPLDDNDKEREYSTNMRLSSYIKTNKAFVCTYSQFWRVDFLLWSCLPSLIALLINTSEAVYLSAHFLTMSTACYRRMKERERFSFVFIHPKENEKSTIQRLVNRFFTWLGITSHKPSVAIRKNWSLGPKMTSFISGSQETYGIGS